jgi:hypothetical protein
LKNTKEKRVVYNKISIEQKGYNKLNCLILVCKTEYFSTITKETSLSFFENKRIFGWCESRNNKKITKEVCWFSGLFKEEITGGKSHLCWFGLFLHTKKKSFKKNDGKFSLKFRKGNKRKESFLGQYICIIIIIE